MAPVRVGIIGCGAIARRAHIPDLIGAGAEVTAFAARTLASAEAAARQVGGGHVTDDWRELLERDDVDAVTICTPNVLHAPIAIAAAESGRHILVEKPLATTVSEADAMIAAAAAAGVVLMAAHNVRFAPAVRALRAAVAAGLVGEVTSARAVFCHAGPQAWAPEAIWFRDAASSGGGALTDLGPHVIDLLRFVLNDEITDVTAIVDAHPLEHDAMVAFRTAKGTIGSLSAGWRSTVGQDTQVTLVGTLGTLRLDASGVVLQAPGAEVQALPMGVGDNPCAAFVRAIEDGADPVPSGADGRATVAVIAAAYAAAATGRTQSVETA